MSGGDIIVEIPDANTVPKPTEHNIAKFGPRRLVKLVPIPGSAAPAIWTSPAVEDVIEGQKMLVRKCVVLVSKGPKLLTAAITVPNDFYEKLHDVPVEW